MSGPASPSAIRVLMADDSLACREAVHELIDGAAGFTWAGEASCGEDAVDQTLRLRPDLVLMDIRMPGIGGIEAAARIASQAQPPVMVLITASELPTDVPDAIAAEVLTKHQLNRASLTRLWEDHGESARGRGPHARGVSPGHVDNSAGGAGEDP